MTWRMDIERNITGYIPADQTPKKEYILQDDNFYVPSIHILVITNQGDSIQARMYPGEGPYILQDKGEHPKTINKKLFVNCQRRNGIYSIVDASLDSLEVQ